MVRHSIYFSAVAWYHKQFQRITNSFFFHNIVKSRLDRNSASELENVVLESQLFTLFMECCWCYNVTTVRVCLSCLCVDSLF